MAELGLADLDEGLFRFRSDSTTADDGIDVLKPDNISSGDPGRWLRVS